MFDCSSPSRTDIISSSLSISSSSLNGSNPQPLLFNVSYPLLGSVHINILKILSKMTKHQVLSSQMPCRPKIQNMNPERYHEIFDRLTSRIKSIKEQGKPEALVLIESLEAPIRCLPDLSTFELILQDPSISSDELSTWRAIATKGLLIADAQETVHTRAAVVYSRTPSRAPVPTGLEEIQASSPRMFRKNLAASATRLQDGSSLSPKKVEDFAAPFMEFISSNPTAFHAVDWVRQSVEDAGFVRLSEREAWSGQLERSGKYSVERNGSSIIAFTIGKDYEPGNGASIIATHIDALATRLKPVSKLTTQEGFVQLGVAPYAGALNATWWDRDLGIGGRVLVRDSSTGKVSKRLVKLDWPIARIPTLAPHFGQAAHFDGANKETEMVPIIGVDNHDLMSPPFPEYRHTRQSHGKDFIETQPPRLVSAIAKALSIKDKSTIINWELELFDVQPAQLGGVDKDLIFAPRVDDKLCSWSAIEALLAASRDSSPNTLNIVACFDDEEIGSLLRQGADSNFLPSVISRIVGAIPSSSSSSSSDKDGNSNNKSGPADADVIGQTYANSFLISADVSHAVNPNFLSSYLPEHSPRLNVGVAIQADPNGHTTTDSVSTAFLQRIAEKSGQQLQVFQIRNDSRSGGTVGPMLSSKMGMRAADAGIPQLSMHSIRATIGNKDPGLGVALFKGFFEGFEEVDGEFK